MRQIPIQPVVRLKLARILNEQYGMPGAKAVAFATKFIEALRAANMDIVVGDWMANPLAGKTAFRWEDLAAIMQEFEDDTRAPWNSPELK